MRGRSMLRRSTPCIFSSISLYILTISGRIEGRVLRMEVSSSSWLMSWLVKAAVMAASFTM